MNRYTSNIIVIALLLPALLFLFNTWIYFTWWGNVFMVIAALFAIGTNVVAIWHGRKHDYDISDNDYMKGI
ncbi:hypothetical protein ACFOLA_07840 [Salinicoccus hispanicus]|uniref:Uncharacterized protein n=1 Tax=Salinicoccus hispanicus TaxID=157225 RepID=A0A6N8U3M6_9STAP|nr:hypothetical protein [Salinicoccus hispanicus]MXQ51666.1 hypothetical protein [Salinicoccus hispanicus]